MTPKLTDEQRERYARNLVLPGFGEAGQQKLAEARVLVVGAGGLGSPCAYYLAAVGVGTLGIAEADTVELSNLQRQILHSTPRLGQAKVDSAQESLEALNPNVRVRPHPVRFDPESGPELLGEYDLAVDATDNFETRFSINATCVQAGKPWVHAGVTQFQGQMMTIVPGEGPCYCCVFREPPLPGAVPSGAEAGILGSVAGLFGSLQATEAIKLILGLGDPLVGRMLIVETLEMRTRVVELHRAEDCPVCGTTP